jgi:hypothetical protein
MTYHGHLPCTLFILCFADYMKLSIVYEICAYLWPFQHPLSLACMIFRPDLYVSVDGVVFLHFIPSASNTKGNFQNFGTVSYFRGKLELELQFFTLGAGHC